MSVVLSELKPEEIKNRVIEVKKMRLGDLRSHPYNPRRHPNEQREMVGGLMREIGYVGGILAYDSERNAGELTLLDGHLRKSLGPDFVGDVIILDLNDREADLLVALYDESAYGATINREVFDILAMQIDTENETFQNALAGMAEKAGAYLEAESEPTINLNQKPNPRILPVDFIFTWGKGRGECCLAVRGGCKFGTQSSRNFFNEICPFVAKSPRHRVIFIDNNYFKYDHQIHLDCVKFYRPKYATVRDIMTPDQCKKAGIEYYELGQILDWAEELNEYAKNVILIPKYDCLDKIPAKFMLGYSIPTSHGGTPIPVELFKDWRVHLLGGSWKAQLAYLAQLGESVVSIDNNYIAKTAQYGQYVLPDGETQVVSDLFDFKHPNVRDIALALSVGAIGAKINELHKDIKNDEHEV